jgi:hypothetical protein
MSLATSADGLRRVLEATVGEHDLVAVRDSDPVSIGLRRRAQRGRTGKVSGTESVA